MFSQWGRINRATFGVLLLVFVAIFGVAIGFQFRLPGELFLGIICIPRLHDIGRSAWWVALAILLELGLALAIMFGTHLMGLASLVALLALIVPALILAWLPGDPADNRYGKAPSAGLGFKTMVVKP